MTGHSCHQSFTMTNEGGSSCWSKTVKSAHPLPFGLGSASPSTAVGSFQHSAAVYQLLLLAKMFSGAHNRKFSSNSLDRKEN